MKILPLAKIAAARKRQIERPNKAAMSKVDAAALAQKWSEWCRGEIGQKCLDVRSLRAGLGACLETRLWHAFMDGARAAEKMREVVDAKD